MSEHGRDDEPLPIAEVRARLAEQLALVDSREEWETEELKAALKRLWGRPFDGNERES